VVKRPRKTGLKVRKAEQLLGFRPRALAEGLAIVARQVQHFEQQRSIAAATTVAGPIKATA